MIVLGLGLVAALSAGALYFILGSNKELKKYSIQELSKEKVTEIFDEDDSRIVVAHALGTDTIQNLNEYQSLVDLFEGSEIQPAFYQSSQDGSSEEDGFDEGPQEILQKFSIDISGSRAEGNQLIFTIEDYDPDINYTLSFGTGYKRKNVGRVSRYTYNSFGTYRLRLLASSPDRGSSIYTKSIRISRTQKETTPKENREVFAENNATPPAESETSVGQPQIIDGATRDINEEDRTEENTADDEQETENLSGIQEAEEPGPGEEDNPPVEEKEVAAEKLEDNITESNTSVPAPSPANTLSTPSVLFNADIMPEFPGGKNGLKRYFRKNYTYPQAARESGIEGTVFIRFVVKEDGSISDIAVLKGLGFGCDDEAIRLVRKMPKWIPGEHDGKRVSVYKTMPIGFKLFE
ncbi:MAG: TonB family protein [Bacteroidia bacterium]|nr:TonB family protein [Bacteroidia bacterium]